MKVAWANDVGGAGLRLALNSDGEGWVERHTGHASCSAEGNPEFRPTTEREAPVFSMTLQADVQKEWFLVSTYADRSWWLNLHPEGPGTSHEMLTRGYEQTEMARLDGPPPNSRRIRLPS